jgi:LysM repeat protein
LPRPEDKGVARVMGLKWKKQLVTGFSVVILLWGGIVWGQTYYVQPGDSLYMIAARYGVAIAHLQQNNGLTTGAVYPGQALNIMPQSLVGNSGLTYITKPGDSLLLIAQRYGITETALQQTNNLTDSSLTAGRQLVIPVGAATTEAVVVHQVQAGESLYLIAKKYGVSLTALKKANQITDNTVWAGTILKIPSTALTSAGATATHIVKSGDNLYYIARKYGIDPQLLLHANYLSDYAVLYPGQRLIIPKCLADSSDTSDLDAGVAVYANFHLSQSDLDLFARLVTAEANGESFAGQVAVAATILHRLTDARYPKTIPEIVYQVVDGCYQYSPVLDDRINETATQSAYQAIWQALNGNDPSNGANGFYNPAKTTNQWVRSQTVTATIGNHVFFSY